MARIRPRDSELIARLMSLPRSYFTVTDLEKLLGLNRETLHVTLSRLVKSGVLVRLRKNAYNLSIAALDIEKTANELYFPSYLSFESALSRYGILSQVPYTLTFATLRPSKRMLLKDIEVEYRHLKSELFFGYVLEMGKYIATPEKALLDELYLMSRGKAAIDIEELDLKEINPAQLEEFAEKFPAYLGRLLARVRNYLGTTPATLETKERIEWAEKATPSTPEAVST